MGEWGTIFIEAVRGEMALQEEQFYVPTRPPPELPGTKPPTKEYTWKDPWLQLHM